MDDLDFDQDFGGSEVQEVVPVTVVVGDGEVLSLVQELSEGGAYRFTQLSHSDERTSSVQGIMLFEIRLEEAFDDLNLIREWKRLRPLQPLIAISANDDQDFIFEAMRAGATAYFPTTTSGPVLGEILRNFHKLSEAPRLVEIQNQEMLRSMHAERSAMEAKVRAEGEADANRRTREILDNLTEGFFIVESDLRIAEVTSLSCEEIFGHSIAGQPLGNALGLKSGVESYMLGGLMQLFEDFMPLELNLGLLPKRVLTETGRTLGLHYHPVLNARGSPEKLIVEASDISDAVEAQAAYERAQRKNEALLRILSDREPFKEFLHTSRLELEELGTTHNPSIGKRLLHTLKGNSAVMGLDAVALLIHGLETEIEHMTSEPQQADFRRCAFEIEEGFRTFLHDHHSILQLNWEASERSFVLREVEIDFLRSYIQKTERETRTAALTVLTRSKQRPIRSMLAGYEQSAERLAQQLGKQIKFRLIGGSIRLDPERFGGLMKALIHALRNACDHGIELPDAREDLGKTLVGTVQFKFELKGEDLHVTISDDGAGIQVAQILRKAIEKGLVSESSALAMPRSEQLKLIFQNGFSTASAVTELSGRGVGMACIREEVEALAGEIEMNSRENVGTVCAIRIPSAA